MKNKKLIGISSLASLTLAAGFAITSSAATADLTLQISPEEISASQGQEIEFTISTQNPNSQEIVSTRTWMEYDPAKLEGVSITRGNDLDLTAPGEEKFATGSGLIIMGYGKAGGTNQENLEIATVKMKVLSANTENVDIIFHDYPTYATIKTVNGLMTENILADPNSVKLTLNLNEPSSNQGGNSSSSDPEANAGGTYRGGTSAPSSGGTPPQTAGGNAIGMLTPEEQIAAITDSETPDLLATDPSVEANVTAPEAEIEAIEIQEAKETPEILPENAPIVQPAVKAVKEAIAPTASAQETIPTPPSIVKTGGPASLLVMGLLPILAGAITMRRRQTI